MLEYLKKYEDLEVVVLTADKNIRKDDGLYPDLYDGVADVVKVEYIKDRFLSLIYQKPDLFSAWMSKAFKTITKKYPKNSFDAILTFSCPLSTNILGAKLKRFYGCQWIAHQSDPWVDNPYIHYNFLTKILNQKLESECFSYADKLVFVSKEATDFYKQKYPQMQEKIFCIEHSFDGKLYTNRDNEIKNDKIVFRYIGSFYAIRTPEPFFAAMKLVNEKLLQKMKFEIVGGGRIVKILIDKYCLHDFVTIVPRVSYLKSLELMHSSDILVVIDAPSQTDSIFFPSKLVDYIGSRKPIFGISPKGTSMRIIKDMGYECFEPDEMLNISNSIAKIILGEYPKKAQEAMLSQYQIESNIKILKGLI
jgi:glycosyltransferase involved in cell wall biosynthesis